MTALSLGTVGADAQSYPARSIKIVVPATPGGAIDVIARLLGDKLARDFYGELAQRHTVVRYDRLGAGLSDRDLPVPASVELAVTDTEPGVKGDTVSNVTKPATLETGAIVQVPLFVNVGDRIKVDPREARYISRA